MSEGRNAPRNPTAGATPTLRVVRHGVGFVVSGGIAFSVDALVLLALTSGLGGNPFGARLVAISMAMVAGWLAHRRLTWGVTVPPRASEFAGYAAIAWISAALNYAVYAGILLAWPQTTPLAALVAASLVAMFVSYAGMRWGVFRRTRRY